ncbi:MAG: RagB/SusD family nutrient uptake outer membrane protein [Chitinophagaceae bacterium]
MKKHNFKLRSASAGFLLAMLVLTSCKKDYLSFDYTDGGVKENDIWNSDRHARGFLNNAYLGILRRYDITDGALLAAASDEAVNSNQGSTINIFNNGTWGPLRTWDDQYANMYNYIRRTNLFLERSPTSKINPATDIPSLRGEAFFLRAYYHFELFKRYGSIIVVNRSFGATEELDLPRNTYDEVVAQILSDCDSAIANLVVSISDQAVGDKGRASQTAAMAIKARTLLYAASPLNNVSGDVVKWQKAADAAKAIINLNKHSLIATAQYQNIWNYTAQAYNSEVLFASQADNVNSIESANAPISYDGARGRTNPTQEMVDAFEMRTTGKPIADPTSGYDKNAPYVNRDNRLGLFIMFNGSVFKSPRLVETFVGGKDNVPANINNTKTGYYMRKFLYDGANWAVNSATNLRRPWVHFRYAEVLLNYAEALNEAQGPVADVYSSINQVRVRAGMPALPTALTKDQMRLRIQNERRVELCFEEHRFFDVRRWKKGEEFFNKPVSGMVITKTGTTLTYEVVQVESRVFTEKNYLFPFPQSELNRATKLKQNPGW